MLTIVWDPTGGSCRPDGIVYEYVQILVEEYRNAGSELTLHIGSGLIIDEFRLAITKEQLQHNEVQFIIDGEVCTVNEYANFNPWPKGFNDKQGDLCRDIVTMNCAKRRAKQNENQGAKEQEAA